MSVNGSNNQYEFYIIIKKSWDNPPDHGMASPAAPVRDKTDMASQLRSMEAS